MKAKTGSQQWTHNKQLFTLGFPLDSGNLTADRSYALLTITTDEPNTDETLKTAEDKHCCSIHCRFLSTAEDTSTAHSRTDHL